MRGAWAENPARDFTNTDTDDDAYGLYMRVSRLPNIFTYALAVLLGLAAGFLEITISDLLVTAIFVMFATMVLGFIRPRRAWQWAVIVAVFVPLLRLAAYILLNQHSDRAQIWESAMGFVTGTVGAYAGVLGRLGVDTLFRPQQTTVHHGGTETRSERK
jgi:hypothetical protein